MQFVLTDTKEASAIDTTAALGKVNCGWLTVDGHRFAPGTALVVRTHWVKGQHLVIEVDRIEERTADIVGHLDEIRAAMDDIDTSAPLNFTVPDEHLAEFSRIFDPKRIDPKWSLAVDNLLMRCEPLRASRTARLLRWIASLWRIRR